MYSEYRRGGGRWGGLRFIMRVSPKTIPTIGEDRRSLSCSIFYSIFFNVNLYYRCEVHFYLNFDLRYFHQNMCLESFRTMKNIVLPMKSKILTKKNFFHPFVWKPSVAKECWKILDFSQKSNKKSVRKPWFF